VARRLLNFLPKDVAGIFCEGAWVLKCWRKSRVQLREGGMNRELWVVASCGGVSSALGVAIAEWIDPTYAVKPIIVGLGGGIGAISRTQIVRR
jgi:hypothetical protein